MIFWLICALMTFAAVVAVIFPYLKKATVDLANQASDLEVYKDQLKEVDNDETRGLISKTDAANARIEVSRRILKADADLSKLRTIADGQSGRLVAILASLALPIISWALYSNIGSPALPDQPMAARMNAPAAEASVEVLVAKAEAHLRERPDDGKGWEVIAPIYLRMNRFEDSANAYRTANKLLGPAVRFELGLGQALAGLNQGQINSDAMAAFERAKQIDPADPQPKILIATALAQQGKYSESKAAFEQILANAPANAPWRAIVTDSIGQLNIAMEVPAAGQQPGPTAADVEQAAGMAAGDRTAMIEGMVSQLDAKLLENPEDLEGWKRLLRSYGVLNKPDKAKDALVRAREGLKNNSAGLSEINAMAVELGFDKL